MRFIYQYPELGGTDADFLDSGPIAELARAAEGHGWDGFAFTEHPVPGARWLESGGHQSFDPLVALSHVAAVTSRLRLLTYLAVVPYRNPFLLAKAATTVDRLSEGRLTLGVGTGYLKTEYFALGVDFEERNELFDEALDAMTLHWKGEPFSYQGRHFDARNVIARPRPAQDPIPVWIGGNSRRALRRVAEKAQGWMPLTGSPELSKTARTAYFSSLDEVAAKVAELREMAGPRGATIEIALSYTDSSLFDDKPDTERHREALGRIAAVGSDWLVVPGPKGSATASFEFLESFATDYM